MEIFFRSLKTEWVWTFDYRNFKEKEVSIMDYLLRYYSQIGLHRHNQLHHQDGRTTVC